MNALRPEFASLASATTQLQMQHEDVAGWVESIESRLTALQAQQNATPAALRPVAVQQIATAMTWDAALQHLADNNESVTNKRMVQLTQLDKSTVSRRLARAQVQ